METKLATITVILAGLFLATFAQAQGSLEGAWQATEVTVSGGPNEDTTNTDPDLSLLLFTEGHYSAMRNIGNRPDPVPEGQTLTDEQRLAAFVAFRANTGTYEVSGSKLMFHVMLNRNPRDVGNTNEAEYRIEGDNLFLTYALNDEGAVLRLTYTRLD
jgi:hypothetical protein